MNDGEDTEFEFRQAVSRGFQGLKIGALRKLQPKPVQADLLEETKVVVGCGSSAHAMAKLHVGGVGFGNFPLCTALQEQGTNCGTGNVIQETASVS
jgi:hypothetical protein